MRELSTADKARLLIKVATGEEYGDGMLVTDISSDYAEPSYNLTSADGIVVYGNWNDKRTLVDGEWITTSKTDTLPSRLCDALENIGADIEWCDEWTNCAECYKAMRTQADSYGWTMYGAFWEDGYVCADCLKEHLADFIEGEDYINNASKCLMPMFESDLEALGFIQWEAGNEHTYESGWHPGQDDNPKDILASILEGKDEDDVQVVFLLNSVGQFDMRFSAYVKVEDDNGEDTGE
jgi:hypothetical protein